MKNIKCKIMAVALVCSSLITAMPGVSTAYNGWADSYIDFCRAYGIISGDENGNIMPDSNLTKEQMAKMILETLSIKTDNINGTEYEDISPDRWSYRYISKFQEYAIKETRVFNPTAYVTREEFLAMTMKVAGLDKYKLQHEKVFKSNISDWEKISNEYYHLIAAGFEKGCIKGSDGELRPGALLTRAEACALLYRVSFAVENNKLSDIYYEELNKPVQKTETKKEEVKQENKNKTQTALVSSSAATLEQAKKWAKNRGAHQRYIDIADLYWKYGELTGLRADVLYAQAAKETNFGKYTGKVKPEQNNWAGIKKYGATGDETDDHEYFATPEDGVRGHFNHMCAYVGLQPIGETHGRYKSVKSLSWAGTVKTVEQLGGKWCPNTEYGYSIINDYLNPMINTAVK